MANFIIINNTINPEINILDASNSADRILSAARVINRTEDYTFDCSKAGLTPKQVFEANAICEASKGEKAKNLAEVITNVSKFNSESVKIRIVPFTDFGNNKVTFFAEGKTFEIKDELKKIGFQFKTGAWEMSIKY